MYMNSESVNMQIVPYLLCHVRNQIVMRRPGLDMEVTLRGSIRLGLDAEKKRSPILHLCFTYGNAVH